MSVGHYSLENLVPPRIMSSSEELSSAGIQLPAGQKMSSLCLTSWAIHFIELVCDWPILFACVLRSYKAKHTHGDWHSWHAMLSLDLYRVSPWLFPGHSHPSIFFAYSTASMGKGAWRLHQFLLLLWLSDKCWGEEGLCTRLTVFWISCAVPTTCELHFSLDCGWAVHDHDC